VVTGAKMPRSADEGTDDYTKDEGQGTKDKGQRTKDKGQRTKDEGRQRTKGEGRRLAAP
jgi:hypothetical protein